MKTVTCKFCDHDREVYDRNEIRHFRIRHKLSLKEFGRLINKSPSFINDCEHDRRNLSSKTTAFMKCYDLREMLFKG